MRKAGVRGVGVREAPEKAVGFDWVWGGFQFAVFGGRRGGLGFEGAQGKSGGSMESTQV